MHPELSTMENIDIKTLKKMVTSLGGIFDVPVTLLDAGGNVLASSEWQDFCQHFFLDRPATIKKCLLGDTFFNEPQVWKSSYRVCTCQHGLSFAISPIVIDKKTKGYFLVGGFFTRKLTSDELDSFRIIVGSSDFDRSFFTKAIGEIPILSERKLNLLMEHQCSISELMAGTIENNDRREDSFIKQRALENEQHLKGIVNGNIIPTFVIDQGHHIIHWNAACEKLFNISATRMVGTKKQWVPFYPSARPVMADMIVDQKATVEDLASSNSKWKPYAAVEGAFEVEGFFPGVGPEGKWLYLTAAPIKDRNGEIVGAIQTIQDVTARNHREENLSIFQGDDGKTSSVKNVFLKTMSHELKTPMHAIAGMASTLKETSLSSEQQRYVRVILTAADFLLNLIDNVLDFAQIESKTLHLEQEPYALQEMIFNSVEMFSFQAEEKGLSFKCQIDQDVPSRVLGDMHRLSQVLVNLLDNAMKYTDYGGVELNVSVEPPVTGSHQYSTMAHLSQRVNVLFCIQDTGAGIPSTCLEDTSRTFVRSEDSASKHFGGAGLGLRVSKELVNEMGGRIWVESCKGEYSRFLFTVPLKVDEAGNDARAESKISIGGRGKQSMSPLRILSVDDLLINHEIISSLLTKRGYTVQEAYNGQEALQMLQQEPFDLVLMDIKMPVMDGLEATRRIRAHIDPQIAAVPIIAVTAHAIKGDRERYLEAGINAYLGKPLRLQTLLQVINDLTTGPARVETSPTRKGTSSINLEFALSLLDNDEEILKISCNAILRELPALLLQIEDALLAGDCSTVERLAHSIKSSAKSIDAGEVAELALEIENVSGEHRLEEAEYLWPVFKKRVEMMLEELGRELQERL